jgi:hypothetical protein
MRGQTLTKTGNFRQAQTTLEKGLQIAKDMFRTTPNHPLIAQSYLHLGLLLIEPSSVKDLDDARRYLTKAKDMSVDVYSECDRQQFWKFDDSRLKNKAKDEEWCLKIYNENGEWNLKSGIDATETTVFIENVSTKMVLSVEDSGKKVIEEQPQWPKNRSLSEPTVQQEDDNRRQIWYKSKPDRKGYFTLTNNNARLLTAVTSSNDIMVRDAGKHMTTVKAYCGLARLELAQPESSRQLDLARDHIEAGLSMVKEILPNSIAQVELLIVKGDIELLINGNITAVLVQRPEFYGSSWRFKNYGYSYGSQSLMPFQCSKVLFVVFLVFFQNGG